MNDNAGREFSAVWRPPIDGVEVLHARFIRHKYPRHTHESTTVALMEAGAAAFMYRGKEYVVGPGDVFLLDPDIVHTGRPLNPEGYLYRVLYLDAPALHPLLIPGRGASQAVLSCRETVLREPAVAALLRRIHHAITQQESWLLSEELLLRVARMLLRRAGAPSLGGTRNAGCARVVKVARDYLDAHPADKILLRDLAAVAQTSPYRLVRMFSTEVGMPPHAYQTQLRVSLARRLLAKGVPAVTVAAQSGFCDQAHLSKVFKSYTGVSPAQFSFGARRRAALE